MGTDYGRGMTNIDLATGIRFGVMPQNDVLQAWCDSSESVYPDPEPQTCETCGGSGKIHDRDCSDCGGEGHVEPDDMGNIDPIGWVYEADGYFAHCGDDGDIFIEKSPYFTVANYCSPCAPGAVYLRNVPAESADAKGYCFGHDWFESGRAPYRVFRVSDGTEVIP